MAAASLPVSHRTDPIEGWRIWNLALDGGGRPVLRPAGSGVDAWEPREAQRARCALPALLTIGIGRHDAPDPRCRCGIYASRSLADFERPRPAWPPPTVVGTVALWGTVIEHERGWRAQHAYPARVRLVCPMCAWFEPGPGTPEVVHAFAGLLYALCADHRGGIQVPDGRRTQPTPIDPARLQEELLDAYAVDLLPAEAVAALVAQPPTVAHDPYLPTIRPVPADAAALPVRWPRLRALFGLRPRR
jgi:hypothetical protein